MSRWSPRRDTGYDWARLNAEVPASGRAAYLDRLRQLEPVQAVSQRLLVLADIRPGDRVLDVGCGIGHDVRTASRHAGRDGFVVGLDRSHPLLMQARAPAEPASYVSADALSMPLAGRTFDVVLCNRVLQHVPDPGTCLREIVRVMRSSGHLVVAEPDWGTAVIGPGDALTGEAVISAADLVARHPRIGRGLAALLAQIDLVDVHVEVTSVFLRRLADAIDFLDLAELISRAVAYGRTTEDAVEAWRHQLETADKNGTLVFAMEIFIAMGRKSG
ncbi:MAG: methyltransferase domain-containing protein [Anaerolineae bacterium]